MESKANIAQQSLAELPNETETDKASVQSARGDLPREIEVQTAWGQILGSTTEDLAAEQVSDHEVWLVNALFNEHECELLLRQAETHGFGTTNYPKAYRGNLRLITTDSSLSDAVWQRLRPLVPPTLTLDGDAWDACGLNECWRLAKYYPGDVFKGHCDASFARSNDEMSMLTVNIYMNGGFAGGRTRFFFGNHHDKEGAHAVTPSTGLCLLFRQPPGKAYYHDGERLESGVKYLFRSDVMYRKRQ